MTELKLEFHLPDFLLPEGWTNDEEEECDRAPGAAGPQVSSTWPYLLIVSCPGGPHTASHLKFCWTCGMAAGHERLVCRPEWASMAVLSV